MFEVAAKDSLTVSGLTVNNCSFYGNVIAGSWVGGGNTFN
jgi:hypothetical protein